MIFIHLQKHLFKILFLIFFSVTTSLSAHILRAHKDSFLCYYSFDTPYKNNLKDHSHNNMNGEINNDQNFWTSNGISDGAGDFKNNVKVTVPGKFLPSKYSEFTISLWIKPDNTPSESILFSKRSYENEFFFFSLGIDNLKPFCRISNGDNIATTAKEKTIPADSWSYLCLIYKGNTLSLYVNGKLIEKTNTDFSAFDTKYANLSIGSDFDGEEKYFNGLIDELMFLNVAISPELVAQEYLCVTKSTHSCKEIEANQSGLIKANFAMNEGRGKTILNKANPMFNGKLSSGLERNWKSGYGRKSLLFQASKNQFITVESYPDLNLNKSFTILCWIRPTAFGKKTKILSKIDLDPKRFYLIGEHKGKLYAGMGDGKETVYLRSDDSINLHKWQQIGITFNHIKHKFGLVYNGTIIKSTITYATSKTGDFPLIIGGRHGHYFSGEINNLRIFNISMPYKLIHEEFLSISQEDAKRKQLKAQKAMLKTKFYSAVRQLNDINEMLEIEDYTSFSFIKGQEEESFKKITDYIETKKAQLSKIRNQAVKKCDSLKSTVMEIMEKINSILQTKGSPLINTNLPSIGPYTTLYEIRKICNTLSKKEGQLIKQLDEIQKQ